MNNEGVTWSRTHHKYAIFSLKTIIVSILCVGYNSALKSEQWRINLSISTESEVYILKRHNRFCVKSRLQYQDNAYCVAYSALKEWRTKVHQFIFFIKIQKPWKSCEISKSTLGSYFEIFWLCIIVTQKVFRQLVAFDMLNHFSITRYVDLN